MAWKGLCSNLADRESSHLPLTAIELEQAEIEIVKIVQHCSFAEEICQSNFVSAKLSQNSALKKLTPVIFKGLLRVSKRIEKAPVPFDVRHPIILPSDHHVTQLIFEDHHRNGERGRMANTWASLRNKYWVVRGSITVRKIWGKCISCKKRREKEQAGRQIMTELPEKQLTPGNPPFYFTGVDYFGLLYVKQDRKLVKRYGYLFTCLTMSAVLVEISPDLSSSSFIHALRRFIGRRVKPRKIFIDNGTNLVGAEKELRKAMDEIDSNKVDTNLRRQHMEWQFNPVCVPHGWGL